MDSKTMEIVMRIVTEYVDAAECNYALYPNNIAPAAQQLRTALGGKNISDIHALLTAEPEPCPVHAEPELPSHPGGYSGGNQEPCEGALTVARRIDERMHCLEGEPGVEKLAQVRSILDVNGVAREIESYAAEAVQAERGSYRRGCKNCEDGMFDEVSCGVGFCLSCGGVAILSNDQEAVHDEAPEREETLQEYLDRQDGADIDREHESN